MYGSFQKCAVLYAFQLNHAKICTYNYLNNNIDIDE